MEIIIEESVLKEIFAQITKDHEGHVRVGFLFGEQKGDGAGVNGVLVPEQESSDVSSYLSSDSIAALVTRRFRETGVLDIIGLAFYHPLPGPPYESNIERECRIKQFEFSDIPGFSILFNSKGEHRIFKE